MLGLGIVALVSPKPATAFAGATAQAGDIGFIDQWLDMRDTTGPSARKQKTQRYAVSLTKHMNPGASGLRDGGLVA
ncbi:hypothetical protein AWM79_20095 [Pseudomonas agarici]|uniref:Uncharacterized protein n=1 Tax=Pseudomonas agarici TaxID=46677 RepID=A0A0X1T5Y0_PSEAA|nr:hypothetical protein AWM79_20095 [Pseudomonas agarici]